MGGEVEVFFGDLDFYYQWCVWYGFEQWVEWFVWLEVDGFVFDLKNYIWQECFVQVGKFGICLCGLVCRYVMGIDEGVLYDYVVVCCQCVGQQVGIVGMCLVVILWVGLIF